MVTAWRMRKELGMEIAQRICLYLVQKCLLAQTKITRHATYPASPIPAVLDKRNRVLSPRSQFQGGKQAVEAEIYIEKYVRPSISFIFKH